ncbi:MAG: S1 RNA-binding domain-containing protein [Euryarchaeota archaeon]|nr:S1 RNA-binding domain-containing protein [Euryarchaeota archaeon]
MMYNVRIDLSGHKSRELVFPGDTLGNGRPIIPTLYAYFDGSKTHSAVIGIPQPTKTVIPLNAKYIPKKDDIIIGIVEDVQPVFWLLNLNSPYPGVLHANETPWEVGFGETGKYLNVGDAVIAKIQAVDETRRVFITMKDERAKKLTLGTLFFFPASKVARILGKGGSMISMIKQKTGTSIIVGQNGVVWVRGHPIATMIVGEALDIISRYSHVIGLTELVAKYIDKRMNDLKEFFK